MSRRILTAVMLLVVAAAPAIADAQQGRSRGDRQGGQGEGRQARQRNPGEGRLEVRVPVARRPDLRQYDTTRRAVPRAYAYANRGYDSRGYDPRARAYAYDSRRYVAPGYRGNSYGRRTVIVPRYIRPRIVTVLPYRPYYYRPRYGLDVYYGAGGLYPYGLTPRGYYDPIPGRAYGGVRITDAPRDARVFADGYYVGIVDDFDGAFQHMNLEDGEHRIEVQAPGLGPIAFDIFVQPGRTMTLRANPY